jgi:hypothetical protein
MFLNAMDLTIVDRFEAVLAAMSAAEFDAFWADVKAESGPGPSAAAFIAGFDSTSAQELTAPTFHVLNADLCRYVSVAPHDYAMAA